MNAPRKNELLAIACGNLNISNAVNALTDTSHRAANDFLQDSEYVHWNIRQRTLQDCTPANIKEPVVFRLRTNLYESYTLRGRTAM